MKGRCRVHPPVRQCALYLCWEVTRSKGRLQHMELEQPLASCLKDGPQGTVRSISDEGSCQKGVHLRPTPHSKQVTKELAGGNNNLSLSKVDPGTLYIWEESVISHFSSFSIQSKRSEKQNVRLFYQLLEFLPCKEMSTLYLTFQTAWGSPPHLVPQCAYSRDREGVAKNCSHP